MADIVKACLQTHTEKNLSTFHTALWEDVTQAFHYN